jgi:thiamine transport system substrate-binding protein
MNARRTVVPALVLALALAACGSSSSNDGSSKTSSGTAAKRGSKTVVLLTHDAFAASKEVLAAFTDETGYAVKQLAPGDAGVAVNTAILRKSHPVADVLYGVDNTFLSRALDNGIFTSYVAPGAKDDAKEFTDGTDGRVTPIDYGDVCLNYDLTWFGHDGRPPAPTSIRDLTKPAYENLTVVENPATASPGLAFLLATVDQLGDGWQRYWKDLRANGVRVAPNWTQAYESDFTRGGGNGDRPIVVSYASSPPADVVYADPPKARPDIGVVESSCFRQVEYAGVLEGAKNEPGARALVDFMASRRFQEDVPLQMFVFPVDHDAALPPVFVKWAARPANPSTMSAAEIGTHRDDWIQEWTDIVVR